MTAPDVVSAVHAVERCLARAGAPWRTVAPGEWGLDAQAGGWPLAVGLALRGGLLRAQAEVLAPGRSDPHVLLHRNRRTVLVRLSHASTGAVWIQGELPLPAVTEEQVDRLLGLVLETADDVRAGAG